MREASGQKGIQVGPRFRRRQEAYRGPGTLTAHDIRKFGGARLCAVLVMLVPGCHGFILPVSAKTLYSTLKRCQGKMHGAGMENRSCFWRLPTRRA